MAKRIYVVRANGSEKLIRAASVTQAIAHVARQAIDGRLAGQDDLLRLAQTVQVEDAGKDGAETGTENATVAI